jgi:hypothetical protein
LNKNDFPLFISAVITKIAHDLTDEQILILLSALHYSIDTLKTILEMRKFEELHNTSTSHRL